MKPRKLLPPELRCGRSPTAKDWVPFTQASNGRRRNPSIRHESGIKFRKARLQDARPFRWAWDQRVLLGYLNLLIGEEGVGKGNLVAWLLGRLTRGELDGDLEGTPRSVAIIGDEDSFENIWVPRLAAAGADLQRVLFIESGTSGVVDVREDAEAIRDFVESQEISVLYFDQLLDNLGYADSWKDKQVRDALAPLRNVVQETEIAALLTMHPNKRKGSFRDRVSGTPAFNALSRSSLLVTSHPQEPGRRVAVRAKGNYSAEPPGFEFFIEEHVLDNKARGKARHLIKTSRLYGIRESALKANDVLDAKQSRRQDDSKVGQARLLLTQLLSDGKAHKAKAVQDELLAQYGLAQRVVSQAAAEIGVKKYQQGFPSTWFWRLPQGERSRGDSDS